MYRAAEEYGSYRARIIANWWQRGLRVLGTERREVQFVRAGRGVQVAELVSGVVQHGLTGSRRGVSGGGCGVGCFGR